MKIYFFRAACSLSVSEKFSMTLFLDYIGEYTQFPTPGSQQIVPKSKHIYVIMGSSVIFCVCVLNTNVLDLCGQTDQHNGQHKQCVPK